MTDVQDVSIGRESAIELSGEPERNFIGRGKTVLDHEHPELIAAVMSVPLKSNETTYRRRSDGGLTSVTVL